jgi:hypothetical protein
MDWSAIKNAKLPLWEAITGMVAVAGIAWAAFAWADEVQDKQLTTQGQLDQLILVVSTTTQDNYAVHKSTNVALTEQKLELELLKQEIELRRELEGERPD